MIFKDNRLEFLDTKILDTIFNMEVMMSWEAPLMEKSAEYICSSKGDILEVGFGMGICADYIQAQGVNSHTIIDIHPQIIERLKTWAEDKPNVIIVEGDWNEVSLSSTYDGIFMDTYQDDNWVQFTDFLSTTGKQGAKFSYWNGNPDEENIWNFSNISFEEISITPEANKYTRITDTYYMPKVVL